MIVPRSNRFAFGRRVAAVAILGACLPCLAPRAQGALLLHGTVRDEQGRPVARASIIALRDSARAESDVRGEFMLRLATVGNGTQRVSVRRLGFAPLLLNVEADGAIYPAVDGTPGMARGRTQSVHEAISVKLRHAAQPLSAIVVFGRRELRGPMAGFYARREMGHGRFFTAEDVARRSARRMTDLLRGVPGLQARQRNIARSDVRLRGATIAPLVWLDGVPMATHDIDLDRFDPRLFAGIEVYSGSASVPLQFAGGRAMSTSGGTIVLWSRQGEALAREDDAPDVYDVRADRGSGGPEAEQQELAAAASSALISRLLERGEAYTADLVSVPARPLRPIVLHYPASLRDARVTGRVEVEFVVDETGRLRMDTFGVVSSSHPALVEAVRRSLENTVRQALEDGRQEFTPATLDGRAVAQLVQQPFEFRLDGGPGTSQQRD